MFEIKPHIYIESKHISLSGSLHKQGNMNYEELDEGTDKYLQTNSTYHKNDTNFV